MESMIRSSCVLIVELSDLYIREYDESDLALPMLENVTVYSMGLSW